MEAICTSNTKWNKVTSICIDDAKLDEGQETLRKFNTLC